MPIRSRRTSGLEGGTCFVEETAVRKARGWYGNGLGRQRRCFGGDGGALVDAGLPMEIFLFLLRASGGPFTTLGPTTVFFPVSYFFSFRESCLFGHVSIFLLEIPWASCFFLRTVRFVSFFESGIRWFFFLDCVILGGIFLAAEDSLFK